MTNAATGIGHNQRTTGASSQTATRKMKSDAAQKPTTAAIVSAPVGSSRPAVRGLAAEESARSLRLLEHAAQPSSGHPPVVLTACGAAAR